MTGPPSPNAFVTRRVVGKVYRSIDRKYVLTRLAPTSFVKETCAYLPSTLRAFISLPNFAPVSKSVVTSLTLARRLTAFGARPVLWRHCLSAPRSAATAALTFVLVTAVLPAAESNSLSPVPCGTHRQVPPPI